MAKVPKKQTAKPPPADKLLKPAAGIALAILAYYFMKGVTNEITRVDVTDQLALREVFFGEGALGKDYAVSYLWMDLAQVKVEVRSFSLIYSLAIA